MRKVQVPEAGGASPAKAGRIRKLRKHQKLPEHPALPCFRYKTQPELTRRKLNCRNSDTTIFLSGKTVTNCIIRRRFFSENCPDFITKNGQKCLESVTNGGLFRRWQSFTRHTVLSAGCRGGPSRAAEGDADFPSLSNDRFAATAPDRHKTQAAASVPGYRARELFFGNSGGISYGRTDRHHAPATTSQRPSFLVPMRTFFPWDFVFFHSFLTSFSSTSTPFTPIISKWQANKNQLTIN